MKSIYKFLLLFLLSLPCFASWQGTAFFVNAEGYAVTAGHMITGQHYYWIEYKKLLYPVKLIAYDQFDDVAIVHLDGFETNYIPLNLKMYVGEKIGVYGYPEADVMGKGLKFAPGKIDKIKYFGKWMLHTTAYTCEGNSGGPIVNA